MASVVRLCFAEAAPLAEGRRPAQRHPNPFDLRRIQRVLENRKRYRYVTPSVTVSDSGYLIQSPCCSRTVDAEGGVIDVALLRHSEETGLWSLYRKDHAARVWTLHSTYADLNALLDHLNEDPGREFWQ
jgi:hypothetical protein